MTRLRDLLPASFNRVEFFVRSEILTEAGRRIVLHEYPNSSQRFIEDLGQLPPRFSVTAFVSGPDYLNRADQLERALQKKGQGRLVLPNFGVLKVFALPYRKDASQIAVGEIRFELEFAQGRAISGPIRAPASVEQVYSLGDEVRSKLGNTLNTKWIEPTDSSNVQVAQYDLDQAARATSKFLTSVNNVGELETITGFIGLNGPSIVRSAYLLKSVFIDQLWQTISVGLNGGKGLPIAKEITRFGSQLSLSLSDIRSASTSYAAEGTQATAIPLWPPTTGVRVIRNDNRLTLANSCRIAALSVAYEQASDATYATDVELDETRKGLEDEHQRLMRDDTENVFLVQSDPEVRRAIENLRLAALEVLDQKEQSTFELTTINRNASISAYVLAYSLYAEEFETSEAIVTRATLIRNLNPTMPSDRLNGEITVLQA